MKKLFFYVILIFCSTNMFGQNLPEYFKLGNSKLAKISSSTPLSNGITDIIVEDNIVLLGTSRGLSTSTDDGETWTNYFDTPDFGTESISAIAYKNGVIWAATAHSEDVNGESVQVGSGLHYSTDGKTWTNIPQPVDDSGDSLITYGINTIRALPVTVAQQNVTFDIALTDNAVWITSWAGGLRKSTDNGTTWQRVILPPDFLDSIKPSDTLSFSLQPVAGSFGPEAYLNHALFSVLAVDNNTIYAGSAGGLNKSTDGGISWRHFTNSNQRHPMSGNWVIGLGYDKFEKAVWAVTRQAESQNEVNGVSASFDGGENWDTSLLGKTAWNIGFRYYLDGNGNLTSSDVIIPTNSGAFRSNDNGNTWINATGIVDSQTGLSINTDVYYGAASKNLNSGNAYVWLGSAEGTVRLTDTGGMWEGIWKVFLASQDLTSDNSTYAFPNPFSPGLEKVKIKYTTGNSSAKVTIRILDFDMNLVKTVIQNAPRNANIDNIDKWDGTDEFGNIVPNGVYFYRIDIDSGQTLYGKIIALK